MEVIGFLILFPFLTAAVLTFTKNNFVRKLIVYFCSGIIMVASVGMAFNQLFIDSGTHNLMQSSHITHMISAGMLAVEFFIMCVVVYLSFKHKRFQALPFAVAGTAITAWLELTGQLNSAAPFMMRDNLSAVMCIIIAVVGGMICIYAVGYMNDYHKHHTEFKDRRTFFFPMLFVFLGAMFGLVTSSNLTWIYFFWEITSVASFLLIGYTRTEEAITNSFRALWMNLLGGLAFACAIAYSGIILNVYTIQELLNFPYAKLTMLPVILIAFAALTKSAQMPFSKWLLGAMVAPTPTSALLHSATMVKAGVYILLRLAPAMSGNMSGTMVSLIGGFTFLIASMLAITVSDGKKVLAYSTISNLGLITSCAGVGTTETVWAGVFLIMCHAISKSMMFQAVGAVENATGSRDIEDMHGLIVRLPFLAFVMIVGIAGMFLAPFGMLISKWAALKAFVDSGDMVLVLFLAFGSATTMLYWTKWLSKILACKANTRMRQNTTSKGQWFSLIGHAAMMILLCVLIPIISGRIVEPMLEQLYRVRHVSVLSREDMIIMVVMLVLIFIIPVISRFIVRHMKFEPNIEYMSGINEGDNRQFKDSFNAPKMMYLSNWYMTDYFGEKKIWRISTVMAAALIIVCIVLVIGKTTGGVL